MYDNWQLTYSTTAEYQAQMVKDMLKDNGIESVILNRKDSAYQLFGEVEVYVNQDSETKSKLLIKKFFEDEKPD
jgi:hypothetical protein